MKTSTSKSSVVTQISLSLVAIVLSYLLLFNKVVQVNTICQLLCGGLIAVGIISIVSYFMSGDFKRIDRYGFALGTMLVLMGIIGLIRLDSLTTNFVIYTGILSLVLSVLVLQGTVQIKVLDYPVWILGLLLTIVCIAGAICVLLELTAVTNLVEGFSNWTLLTCGSCCLFSMLMTWICILLAARREKKSEKEKDSEKTPEQQEPAVQAPPQTAYQQAPAADPASSAEPAATAEPAAQYSIPAETHHTTFDPAQDMQNNELPPVESPQLSFGDEGGHHSSFESNDNE